MQNSDPLALSGSCAHQVIIQSFCWRQQDTTFTEAGQAGEVAHCCLLPITRDVVQVRSVAVHLLYFMVVLVFGFF